jgi:hypothetical protein
MIKYNISFESFHKSKQSYDVSFIVFKHNILIMCTIFFVMNLLVSCVAGRLSDFVEDSAAWSYVRQINNY